MTWDEISTTLQIIGGIVLGASFVVGIAIIWTGIQANKEKDAKAKAQDERIAAIDLKRVEAELRLSELQTRVHPRKLTDEQKASFTSALKAFPIGTIKLGYSSDDNHDGFTFNQQFLALFKGRMDGQK